MAGLKPLLRREGAEQTTELAKHAEQLDKVEILNGQLIRAVVPAGVDDWRFRHSLGRSYRGGFLVAIAAGTAVPFSEFHASDPSAFAAQGGDSANYVQIVANVTTGAEHTLTFWVF